MRSELLCSSGAFTSHDESVLSASCVESQCVVCCSRVCCCCRMKRTRDAGRGRGGRGGWGRGERGVAARAFAAFPPAQLRFLNSRCKILYFCLSPSAVANLRRLRGIKAQSLAEALILAPTGISEKLVVSLSSPTPWQLGVTLQANSEIVCFFLLICYNLCTKPLLTKLLDFAKAQGVTVTSLARPDGPSRVRPLGFGFSRFVESRYDF